MGRSGFHSGGITRWSRFLAMPTRVSPAPAAEQKQHQKNDQYGFHGCTSVVGESKSGLCNGRLTSSVPMLELAKTEV
jgi:hypothetical protein